MVPTGGFPPAIVGYDNMVYAQAIKKFVMWENYHNLTSESNQAYLAYDFSTNRWDVLALGGDFNSSSLPGSGHSVGMLQFDPILNVFDNYCCFSGSQQYEFAQQMWLFDPIGMAGRNQQTSARPGNTAEASASFDLLNNVYVLFGGSSTWDYSPTNNSFSPMNPNSPPSSGNFSGMAYDNTDGNTYLFGGIDGSGSYTNNLYRYNASTNVWVQLFPNGALPSARLWAGFAYDSKDNIFLMMGGQDNTGTLNDTWTYDPVANLWAQLTPAQSPSIVPGFATFQRLAYDPDDNVFALTWPGSGGYIGGQPGGYSEVQTWFFRYSGTGNSAGYAGNPVYAPTAGSLNHNANGWASEPALASDGNTLYAGWIETGAPLAFENDIYPHPYVSQLSGSTWAPLGNSYLALDSEFGGYDEGHDPSMAVVGGMPWISWNKENSSGNLLPNNLYAKYWTGSSWIGGPVGAVTSGAADVASYSQIVGVGSTPYIAFLETDRSCYPWCTHVFVKQWKSSSWSLVGTGPLDHNPLSTSSVPHAVSISLASDGVHPYVAWTEYAAGTSFQSDSSPQVYVDEWNGSSWIPLGGSINMNAADWAYDVSTAYLNGTLYVAWVERSQTGNNQLYMKSWNGSSWVAVGSGALNRNSTGWAEAPSVAADPNSGAVYVAWAEQQSFGQKVQTYVNRFSGGSWSSLGGSLNVDSVNGSAEHVSLAVVRGRPVASWGEVKYGSLRNIYVSQWNGSTWQVLAGNSAPAPSPSPSPTPIMSPSSAPTSSPLPTQSSSPSPSPTSTSSVTPGKIALVAHTLTSGTSANINTLGANLIVVVETGYWDDPCANAALTDSQSNAWIQAGKTYLAGGGASAVCISYAKNAATSAAHSFTISGTTNEIEVLAFSGADPSAPLDTTLGSNGSGSNVQPGSITPSMNGGVLIAGVTAGGGAPLVPQVDSGYSISDSAMIGSFRASSAYLIQSTASATDPTWRFDNAYNSAAVLASFKAASANSSPSPTPIPAPTSTSTSSGTPSTFALVAHTLTSGTSASIDTLGANLIVVVETGYWDDPCANATLSDSQSNTWIQAGKTYLAGGGASAVCISYAKNAATSAAHSFTISGTSNEVEVLAFSGADPSSPLDTTLGSNSGGTSVQPGSIMPSMNGEVLIAGVTAGGGAPRLPQVNSGYSISDSAMIGSFRASAAYLIQSAATATDPTWTFDNAYNSAAILAAFKVGFTNPNPSPISTPSSTSPSPTPTPSPSSSPSVSTQVAFASAAQSIQAGACSGASKIQLENASGGVINASSAVTVNLSSSMMGAVASFFQDAACTQSIQGVSIAAGLSTAAFYFSSQTSGAAVISASAAGLAGASQQETILASPIPSPSPSSATSAPLINSFSATPANILPGGTSHLAWTVSGAASLSISNGVGSQASSALGSVPVSPGATTTYTLTATNSLGSVQASATVAVSPSSMGVTEIPSTYNSGHPRLPAPDSNYLLALAGNATEFAKYNSVANSLDPMNPTAIDNLGQFRRALIAYLANKAVGNTAVAGQYLNTFKALANLGGEWGQLAYSADDGVGNGGYTLISASSNFLTACGGGSCAGYSFVTNNGALYTINSVTNANTIVLSQNNPVLSGSGLQIRVFNGGVQGYIGIKLAMLYDWLYNDLDSATRTAFQNQMEYQANNWEAQWKGLDASPFNDTLYVRELPYGQGPDLMYVALALYPDFDSANPAGGQCPAKPCGTYHLQYAINKWFNVFMPAWQQLFGTNGGGWHEDWSSYVNAPNGPGLTRWLVPSLLAWQGATGDPIFTREPWLKNFANFTMYLTRPDFTMEHIGEVAAGTLTSEYTIDYDEGAGLGSLNGLAEIYNDPVLRGWARIVNQEFASGPSGFEPSAFPFYAPDNIAKATSDRSALPASRNFDGWGTVFMRSGWTEDDTFVSLRYGDSYWSHTHADAGAFTISHRGNLAIASGNYRPGSNSEHELQYGRQAISQNTLLIVDPNDVYPSEQFGEFDLKDGTSTSESLVNDGGQRRAGTFYNQLFPQFVSPDCLDKGYTPGCVNDWQSQFDSYHMGTLRSYQSTSNYTYASIDITAAYNDPMSANAPNSANRTYRASSVIRNLLFISPGYVIVFDEINATNPAFKKKWLLHSINQPIISGNRYEIDRVDNVTQGVNWTSAFGRLPKYANGTNGNQYQYNGKLVGWMISPSGGSIQVIGGPGKEFWVEDPKSPGTGTNWNQCMEGQCSSPYWSWMSSTASSETLTPVPTVGPIEPGSWRIEESPATSENQDFFLNVMLATEYNNSNVPTTVTSISGPNSIGATWLDGSNTYRVIFSTSGSGGSITVFGAANFSATLQ